jgi:hypothetical protein
MLLVGVWLSAMPRTILTAKVFANCMGHLQLQIHRGHHTQHSQKQLKLQNRKDRGAITRAM